MTQALDQLAALADAAGRERAAAERHEAELRRLLAEGRTAEEAAARREAELVDVLERARVAEEAARERLGACRAQAGAADREHELTADQAAGGDAAAVKKLRAARDHAEELAALVRAHERRTAQLEAERETAEQALTAHQARRLDVNADALAELLVQAAASVDRHLSAAVELVAIAMALSAARPPRPVGAYRPGATTWGVSLEAFERAVRHHSRRLIPGGAFGTEPPLADVARAVVRNWQLSLATPPEEHAA